MKLTNMEKMVLNAIRDNDYEDALQVGGTWLFVATEYSELDAKKARGALSSLVKKGLVEVDIQKSVRGEDESTIAFTEAGEKLFDKADGKECVWGGPRLLKIEEDDVEETKEEKEMTNMTVKELREEAKSRGIKGYSRMKKEQLLELMQESSSEESSQVKVKMYAFTGMYIGEFDADMVDGKLVVYTKAKGELMFGEDGIEITLPEKARWANRVEIM